MPTTLNDIYYNSVSVEMGLGCTIEHNMNSLLDNISVTTTATKADYLGQINRSDEHTSEHQSH